MNLAKRKGFTGEISKPDFVPEYPPLENAVQATACLLVVQIMVLELAKAGFR